MNDPALPKTEFEVLAIFRYQLRRFFHLSEQLTRQPGIPNLQYLLLLQFKGFPKREWATITELAERLQSKHPGVVALVTRCEKLGLVKRHPGRSDGREVEVHLTGTGERAVDRLARLHRDGLVRLGGVSAVPSKERLMQRVGKNAARRRITS